MKSKCSFILKASTALVLALLMLFGTVTTSVAAAVDHAKATAADADTSVDTTDSDAEPEAHGCEAFFAAIRKGLDLADTGAKADLAETGWWSGDYYVYNNISNNGWSTGSPKCSVDSSVKYYYIFYVKYTEGDSHQLRYRYYSSSGSKTIAPDSSSYNTSSNHSNVHDYSSTDNYYYHTMTNNTKWQRILVGFDTTGNSNAGYVWSSLSSLNDLSATCNAASTTINKGNGVKLTGSCSGDFSSSYFDGGNGGKKAVYTYQYSTNGTSWTDIGSKQTVTGSGAGTDSTGVTFTPSTAGTYYVRVIVNDGNVTKDTNAKNDRYATSSNVTITVKNTYAVTYNGNGNTGGTVPSSQTKVQGTDLTLATNDLTKTGYTANGWNTNSSGTGTHYNNGATYSTDAALPLYAQWTANTYSVALDDNSGSGGDGTVTATYGSNLPSVTVPTRTGYTFGGYYSGSTQYINSSGNGVKAWNIANDTTTLTASWTEIKAGATVKAYTDGSESGTGGTVKVGDSGTAGATATTSDSFGIDTASPAIIRASTAAGYEFKGWQFNSTHLKYSFDGSTYTAVASTSTTYGTSSDTTVYVKTDGTSGLTTANTEIRAMFESAKYTITNNGAYHKTGAANYVSGDTGGTFTVSQTGSLNYNTNLTLTATAESGYAVDGIYWSNNGGSTWTKVETTDTTSNGIVTASTNNSFKVTDNFTLKAMFVQVLKLSAFNSYEKINDTVTFVTAPPKKIEVKHTDSKGTSTTYTYSYDGTKAQGNPNSPDVVNASGTLAIATGTYGQGNYIQYYAGDEITLTYSAMATSEILKGVFYNNSANFYVNKPSSAQFVAHSHPSTPAIYMNSAYYTGAQLNSRDFSGVTVDNDNHSVKFTATTDCKNIDVEIGKKRKVYFSDYTNTVITSKNTDDYYYDNEDLSVTGDQLTVKAKQSAVQTNSITASNVRYYKANSDGTKGDELTADEKTALGLSITGSTSTSTSSADGSALVFNGHMPAYDLYIDLNMSNSYSIKLGTKIVSDLGGSKTRLREAASAISITGSTTLNANTSGYVTSGSTSVSVGSSATLTVSGLNSGYMFVGWYWGSDTAPDYEKGFISDKLTLSYAPRKGGTIWAVGTKDLFINGSKYITGKDTNWYAENGSWKNQKMKFDPDRGTKGSYYWDITDTMFTSAGSDFKYVSSNSGDTGGSDTEGKYFAGDDSCFYWCNNDDSKHGKAFFQFLDTETGYGSREVWKSVYSFKETQNGATYGKILKRDQNQVGTTEYQRQEGQGFIDFAESRYTGYSSPLRIYLDAYTKDLDVEATPIYSDLYVSNGFDVGSTVKTDAVTVQPVYNGNVVSSGQTGYFNVGSSTTYVEDNDNSKCHEGTVTKYTPAKKGATVRITKKAGGSDKIAAFLIYDIENRTVRAEKNITAGTAVSGKTPYYFDLTLANEKQQLYIVPIVEESGAKVTITFDASQLNRKQWGDIVTAYAWYSSTNNPALGAYPGQPMIPSDDMSTWTTSFKPTEGAGSNELAGITFSNYVDGAHSWLGRSGVMGTVSDAQQKSGEATGGIINVYNHVSSGTNGEYSRTNYKAQTYDYHEPIALYDRYKTEDSVNISFQMKDGNSSLISWRHHEFDDNNVLNLPSVWGKLNWEYLTNAKGDQYIDMNGNPLGANNKPSATFYVAAKGQVVYKTANNKPTMKYVFHGGHDYEMQGYTATYSDPASGQDRGSYSKSALASGQWDSAITYDAPGVVNSGMEMKYGVQWYVYDAAGNYITTVLSAGIADLSSNDIDTYLGKQLEDMGYAVDGKSVAICYDKPRYMYGDWSGVSNSAENINCGPKFDAYRFEGQWIAAANTDTVKVNVEVAMMTDSGEVLAHSNTAGYGNASASLASGVTFGKSNYATADSSGAWAQTAATDAKLNGIELNASSQNFIGWYYYDANTDEFTKASYKSNEGFRPNYTNKDVTYYAVYRASAVYQYKYTGREGERTYSAAGNDLTAAEMTNGSRIDAASHEADIKDKLPVGIGIFKKTIDFSKSNYSTWNKTPDNNGYILDITGFSITSPTYTLTATYKLANGETATITKSAIYNAAAVDLTAMDSPEKPAGTSVVSYYNKKFLGWYAYDGGTVGDLLSTQANYGLRLTRNQAIIAVYDEDSHALPTDGWSVHIDETAVNKELTTSTTGDYYADTIVRVRNGSDVTATLPPGAKIGVLVVVANSSVEKAPDSYDKTQLGRLVAQIPNGGTAATKSGLVITNMQATTQTNFNRTDIAVRFDYAKTLGSRYCVYAYFYDGTTYHFSAASSVTNFE